MSRLSKKALLLTSHFTEEEKTLIRLFFDEEKKYTLLEAERKIKAILRRNV